MNLSLKEFVERCLHVFFCVVVLRIFFLVTTAVNVRHRDRIPRSGPAIIAANHNSHLDALLLLAISVSFRRIVYEYFFIC